MTQWELATKYVKVGVFTGCDPRKIWQNKDPMGKSAWDELQAMAAEGWELVSVTPLAESYGHTAFILYTFKRPVA